MINKTNSMYIYFKMKKHSPKLNINEEFECVPNYREFGSLFFKKKIKDIVPITLGILVCLYEMSLKTASNKRTVLLSLFMLCNKHLIYKYSAGDSQTYTKIHITKWTSTCKNNVVTQNGECFFSSAFSCQKMREVAYKLLKSMFLTSTANIN